MGKVFNKGLSEDDKKERILKGLKSIEDENKVKNKIKSKDIKEVTDFVNQPLSFEAIELINEIKNIQKNVDYRKLKIIGGGRKEYDFSDYRTFKELFRDLCYRTITIDEAERKQDEFNTVLHLLKKYSPKLDKYVTLKNNLVDNVSKLREEKKLLKGLKIKYFHFIMIKNMKNKWSLKMKKKKKNKYLI